jgi:hypothetical protein
LETTSFLNALRRFIARRGSIKTLFCDNGTNLVGTRGELERLLLGEKIEWRFNPPQGSHMGGSWERLIRSVRAVLKPLLDEFGTRLDDEALVTLFCEAESVVNSRPITPVSNDPNDLAALSPQQILTLRATDEVPSGQFEECDVYSRKRWKQVQYLSDLFWERWRREFLSAMQKRSKWQKVERNTRIGDVVLVTEPNLPRGQWALARVKEIERSRDGLVRSVILTTRTGELRRPIHKLVLILPTD